MALKRKDGDPAASSKKSKRVGFAAVDPGVEANECLKVFLVSSPDKFEAKGSVPVDPIDIGQFFGEDGKIYGYRDLKINVWINCLSFHAYADIKFQGSSDGGKGITELKPALQKIFGESLVGKEEFLLMFASETHYISNIISSGAVIHSESSGKIDNATNAQKDGGDSVIEVVRMNMHSMEVGLLYSRLVPLVFLLIEGSRPIDVTDPCWEIYFIVERFQHQTGDVPSVLLGFSSIYHFFHYPDSTRLRISQILILPPHQHRGHGRRLLECINSIAVSENVYDVTAEEPSEYLQYLRACIDTPRLLAYDPIRPVLDSIVSHFIEGSFSKKKKKMLLYPSSEVIEAARKKLKINKKQFLRCWDVLIFLELNQKKPKLLEDFKACISQSIKHDILDKNTVSNGKHLVELPNEFGQDMTFVVFKSKGEDGLQECLGSEGGIEDDDKGSQEQQLDEIVEERWEEIGEIARKVRQHARNAKPPN